MANFQPPPTYTNPTLEVTDPATGQKESKFNPVWLKWFYDFVNLVNGGIGPTGTLGNTRGAPGAPGLDGHLVAFDGNTGLAIKDGGPPVIFVDAEIPTGAVDGFNNVFHLAHTPNPPGSLFMFHHTGRLVYIGNGDDYTVSGGGVVTFGVPPLLGDVIYANYRFF